MDKKWGAAVAAGLLCLSLAACGGEPAGQPDASASSRQGAAASSSQGAPADTGAAQEFTSPDGTFSITVPQVEGGWTETGGGNDAHLVLDNADRSFTILLQKLPKEQAAARFPDLASLAAYYRQSNLASYGEPTAEQVSIPAAANIAAESYTVTQDGVTAKALVAFFETETAYYIYTITGMEPQYDANIAAQKQAMSSFAET